MNEKVLAYSKPIEGFKKLLLQRRRWMKGAIKLPVVLSLFLFLQALFFPVIIALCIANFQTGILMWLLKLGLQNILIALALKKVGLPMRYLKHFITYELYTGVQGFILVMLFLIPMKIEWKGRLYK